MFKKMMIANLMKIKILKKEKGKIIFKISGLKKISEENMQYEKFLHIALKKLDGIEKIVANFEEATLEINYDDKKVNEALVLAWVEEVKRIGIDNYDFIEKNGMTNLDYVIEKVEGDLDKSIKLLKKS
ncbi:MAG: heavy-metal-associated domain-containing protein [Clostridium sp.]|uniref:heavy-metal-associated domain-containing protein n=1 Tax=Clostridium sp. TaxID=1506 RepID=UPI003F39C32E